MTGLYEDSLDAAKEVLKMITRRDEIISIFNEYMDITSNISDDILNFIFSYPDLTLEEKIKLLGLISGNNNLNLSLVDLMVKYEITLHDKEDIAELLGNLSLNSKGSVLKYISKMLNHSNICTILSSMTFW